MRGKLFLHGNFSSETCKRLSATTRVESDKSLKIYLTSKNDSKLAQKFVRHQEKQITLKVKGIYIYKTGGKKCSSVYGYDLDLSLTLL